MSDRDQQRQDEAPTEANASEPLLNGERRQTLIRGLLIILFAFIYSIAELVVGAIVLLQFGFVLITGARNAKLLELGARTSAYIYQILQYVTFNSDLRPFPFSDWPEAPSSDGSPTSDGGPPPPP